MKKIQLAILLLICSVAISQKKSIYKNVPALYEVSGIWMNADTTAMMPSLRNFRAQALCNHDLSSLAWFASAPYSGGYHTGILRVNNEVPVSQLWRWFPYQALRKSQMQDYSINSAVRMVPDKNVILWKMELTNTTTQTKTFNIEQDMIGFISKYDTIKWGFNYHFPSKKGITNYRGEEILLVLHNIGRKEKANHAFDFTAQVFPPTDSTKYEPRNYPTDEEILNFDKYKIVSKTGSSVLIADKETQSFIGFTIPDAPQNLIAFNSGATAKWNLQLKPGQKQTIRFLMSWNDNKEAVLKDLNDYQKNYDRAFANVKNIWESRWQAIFRQNNNIISGTVPVLETKEKSVAKVYYTGPLTMLYLLNTNLPAHKRVYLTGGPIWGATTTFYWDNNEWPVFQAVCDPAIMKENLKDWLKIDNAKFYAQDNFSGKGVGNGYVANYYSIFNIARAYITVTKDYDFLNEEVNGKKVIDYLYDYAYHWKEVSNYGKPGYKDERYNLADFGDDPWNLLECVPSYKYIVPSFNAAYVWMMRETGKFFKMLGNKGKHDQLNKDADEMARLVLQLYNGDGTWYTLHPYGKKEGIRHVLDFMLVSKFMEQDLSPKIKEQVKDFAVNELIANNWMRAQSLQDSIAKHSDRPDHGPLGAFDGWPPGTIDALTELGYGNIGLAFYKRLATVTYEGSWSQARELWGENKYNKNARVRIAARNWICRDAMCGIGSSQVVLKNFMGFYPQINGETIYTKYKGLNFSGTLYNVLHGGKYYTIKTENGKTTMTPFSVNR